MIKDTNSEFDPTFNMTGIVLEFGISTDEIRKILLDNIPKDSDRYKLLMRYINSNDMEEHLQYPGGYNAFIKDYKNGMYRDIIN